MTKVEAVELFKIIHLPGLDQTDRPLVRTAWNDFVDGLCREGAISERQASTWDQPGFVKKGA